MAYYDRKKPKIKSISLRENVNLLFFIGKGKAHSFRVPFGVLLAGIFSVGSLLIWAVASIVIVLFIDHQNNWLEGQLDATRGVVLKYQAKYEGLYERSYPTSVGRGELRQKVETLDVVEESIPEAPAVPAAPEEKQVDLEPKAAALAASPMKVEAPAKVESKTAVTLPVETQKNATPETEIADSLPAIPEVVQKPDVITDIEPSSAASEKMDKPAQPESPQAEPAPAQSKIIDIVDFKLSRSSESLTLSFGVKNLGKIARVRGLIYSVALWEEAGKDPVYYGLPSKIAINPDLGIPSQPLNGISFSARRFRPTKFKFKKPKGSEGRFSSIRVVILDQKGDMLLQRIESITAPNVAKKSKNQ